RPDLGLLLSIDSQRIVRSSRTLIVPFTSALVRAHASVDDYALTVHYEFVAKHVTVAVTRLVIRAQGSAVENQRAARCWVTDRGVATCLEESYLSAIFGGAGTRQSCCAEKFFRRSRDKAEC